MADISELLLQQRVRNRIIEHFDGATSFEGVAKIGAFEEIEMLIDWVQPPLDAEFFSGPVFSQPEITATKGFCSIVDVACDAAREHCQTKVGYCIQMSKWWVRLNDFVG